MAPSTIIPVLFWTVLSIGGSWAQDDTGNVTLQPSITASRTTAAASRRSDDSNGAHIESLLDLANSLLTSAYPSTVITDIASLEWPATLVLGSSTVVISDPTETPSESSTSTSEPTAASRSNTEDSSEGGGVSLGLILGIVFGVLALLLIILAACLYRRRRSRRRAGGAETPSEDGSDLLRMPQGNREFPEKYSNLPAPPPPRPVSPPFNRYSTDEDSLRNPTAQSVPVATSAIHPAHRNGESGPYQSHSSPYYAPHLHSPPPKGMVQINTQHPYQGGVVDRDSGYYGHSRDSQVAELPGSAGSRYESSSSREQLSENPFTSPAYRVRSQSNTSISRRPVPKESVSSLTRRSDNRLSSQLVLESSEESSETNDTPRVPYVPPRSPKRRSGTYIHYPTASETSDFDFGFNSRRDRTSAELGNHTRITAANRFDQSRR